MDFLDALQINRDCRVVISLVGAGGKTSAMYQLAKEFKRMGKKVLITTTTAIFYPQNQQYNHILISEDLQEIADRIKTMDDGIVVVGSRIMEEMKLKGILKEWVDILYEREIVDVILVEADGSKRKPIKAPDIHEPVIPNTTSLLMGVIGFDAYGEKIGDEFVHRPHIFVDVVNRNIGSVIDGEVLTALVLSNKGLFKGSPSNCKKILLFNKVAERDFSKAEEIGDEILKRDSSIKKILMGRVLEDDPIKKILE